MTDDNKTTAKMDIPPIVTGKRKVQRIQNNFLGQLLICFVCVILLAFLTHMDEIKGALYNITHKTTNINGENPIHFGARRQNLLLMGVDVSDDKDRPFENTRSDSIYLVSIAPHGKNINVISIPRDSKVYIHSRSNPDKINHAFAYGGIDTSIKTIEQTLGVRIDHYLVVSNQALVEFIDRIGGIDVFVEKDMRYHDFSGKLHIDLQKGVRHLDGKQAEGYMRYRKDALGDIGRIRRQQWFLNALTTKMKEPSVILKFPETIKAVSKYIQTDLSLYELAQYAALVKSTDTSKIKVATLPGEPSQRGFISYWILDPEGVQEIVDSFVYGKKAKQMERPLEVGILYVPNEEEKAKELKGKLENLGFVVNTNQVRHLGHNHISIHSFDVPNDAIEHMKNEIPELKNEQTVYDTIGINKAARDFTIVLAGS